MKNTTKLITRLALLAALSIIFGKFLSIKIGEDIRISFENTPIILAGFAYGPLAGAICGTVADIVGCMLYGYAINPFLTVGFAAVGVFAGLFGKRGLVQKSNLLFSVFSAHIVGSMTIRNIGLIIFFGTKWFVALLKIPLYTVIGAAEYFLIKHLYKNKGFRNAVEK